MLQLFITMKDWVLRGVTFLMRCHLYLFFRVKSGKIFRIKDVFVFI